MEGPGGGRPTAVKGPKMGCKMLFFAHQKIKWAPLLIAHLLTMEHIQGISLHLGNLPESVMG